LASLKFRVLQRLDAVTWLEIELETGRMHQIRLQAGSRGWPVVGDWQYGAHGWFGPQTTDWRERWIALHARQLAFRHPITRADVEITAKLPEAWQEYDLSAD
jgi:23S rRNA-/tRNA-specific pseudouridylate synthase